MLKTVLPLTLILAFSATAQESRLGTYRAERSLSGEAQAAGDLNQLRVTVADRQGTPLYTIAKVLAYDVGPPAVAIFESGACVLLDAFHGILEFYDAGGNRVRTIRTLKEAMPELERVMPFAVHDNALTLSVSEPGRSGVRVFRFTDQGEQTFEALLEGSFATGVVISNSGVSCVVGTATWNSGRLQEGAVLLSGSGTPQALLPVGCVLGAFSENDSLLLVTTKRERALVAVADGGVIDRALVATGDRILDVGIQDGAFFVLLAKNPTLIGPRWVHSTPAVVRIDAQGVSQEVLSEAGRQFDKARLRHLDGELYLDVDGALRPLR